MEQARTPVLSEDEIIPFFISVDHDQQRLHEVVQVRLCDVNPREIATSIVSDTTRSTLEAPALLYMRKRVHVLSLFNLKSGGKFLPRFTGTTKGTGFQPGHNELVVAPEMELL